ncbi:DHH family phosphoesterase [Cuneatibacter caecimuris]|uniref:Cyclic-di-AMP phosphodiesterase n=1 Tax=Cuneatibacter caecimuris TaxID=1796618 RepID=A0A4Q7P3H2_9FIRM|nr:DHH family phosphoesterase [Cuneatibacter caecimuris]RZS94364.1 c-di-AMP phosphodiesterase-like protein [Cuneatibacter caecimuris]
MKQKQNQKQNNQKKINGKLKIYLRWPMVFSALTVLLNIFVFMVSFQAGVLMVGFTLLYLVMSGLLYWYRSKYVMTDLVTFAADYAQIQKQLLSEMSVPYAMTDENGRLLWMNQAFQRITGKDGKLYHYLNSVFTEITEEDFPKGEVEQITHIQYKEKKYWIEIKKIRITDVIREIDLPLKQESETDLFVLYLHDETELISYKNKIEEERLIAGLIYLDNYEEALESIEEVRRSLLVALIDRKINKYVSNMGGILKKIEKDKYFVVLKQKYLKELENTKFPLLEDVKTVNIGNEMSVTISIGLGKGGETYLQNYEYARTAIDMALGRGGDQAVIKDNGKIYYYGGKSQSVEKNTRVKARVKAQALRELIEGKEHVMIMGHNMSDVDSIGAGIGIYRAAKISGKKAHIVVNEITSSVKPLMDRFRDNPEYEQDIFINNERALEIIDPNTVLVVVDVNRPSYTECPDLLQISRHIVVLDHHRQTREVIDNAVLSYVEPYASSACEMVAEVLQYYEDNLRLRQLDAEALYAGIVIDTNNFMNKTGVRTFEAAAYLRRCGADVTRVRKMFRDEMGDYKARAAAVRDAEVFEGIFAISICPNDTVESPTIIGAQAANELLNIRGIKASFVLTEFHSKIYISARSIDEVNVQVIMERLGGGGHMTIAGAQLTGMDAKEAKEKVKEVLQSMTEGGEI